MKILIIPILLILSSLSHSSCFEIANSILREDQRRTIRLYTSPGIQSDNYMEFVKKAISKKPEIKGKRLEFNDGSRFEIVQTLGAGGTTLILKAIDMRTGQEVALRLPKSTGLFIGIIPFTKFNKSSVEALDDLKSLGAKIPKVYSFDKTGKGEYMAVELINIDFDGYEFLAKTDELGLSSQEMRDAKRALIDFSREHAHIAHIGDFKADQLTYSIKDQRWTILDWNNGNGGAYPASEINSPRLFDDYFFYNLRATRFDDGTIDFNIDTFEPNISRENNQFELLLQKELNIAVDIMRNKAFE